MTSSRRSAATAAFVVLALAAGCGLLPVQPVDVSAARTRYAGSPGKLRAELEREFGELPEEPEVIAYSGSVENCS